MDFFKNLNKRTFCSTSRYLERKEKPKKTKDKWDNKRKKEKKRESEKRNYKKERKKLR